MEKRISITAPIFPIKPAEKEYDAEINSIGGIEQGRTVKNNREMKSKK